MGRDAVVLKMGGFKYAPKSSVPPLERLVVVKINAGVGNPLRDFVVVILKGWLPFGWLSWLSLFFFLDRVLKESARSDIGFS